MRDNTIVGTGVVMPHLKSAHNYQIKDGWVVVSVHTLNTQNLACWEQFPTGSGVIEENSFSAWLLT
jgi:hypothetical protein